MQNVPITVAYGDGIGPEIMEATLHVLKEAKAAIDIEVIEIGKKVYERGITSGIEPSAWDALRRNKVFLKAPITTPQGGGVKSLNVTARKTLGLYANVRPCVAYAPFVETKYPFMDVVIIRENEEDLYGGIEHRQTNDVTQCLKLITRPGTEKIVRYAFEYARLYQRKKVTCFTKDNIMKLTDGLFHQVFEDVAQEYPDIEHEHRIIDIGTAKLATAPEQFDVLVLPNLYGDILSDITAEMKGSVGLVGSANVGDQCSMFEAIHGSAPDIAGQNIANPSGLIKASAMMLAHISQPDVAEIIHNAWRCALEDGIHTPDIASRAHTKKRVSTQEFAEAVVERFGETPKTLKPVSYERLAKPFRITLPELPRAEKELVGVDVFLDWWDGSPQDLGDSLKETAGDDFHLVMITNRGTKVYPDGFPETFCVDHWRCRFRGNGDTVTHQQVIGLLSRIAEAGFDFIKTEHLCTFDGEPGFSRGQGE